MLQHECSQEHWDPPKREPANYLQVDSPQRSQETPPQRKVEASPERNDTSPKKHERFLQLYEEDAGLKRPEGKWMILMCGVCGLAFPSLLLLCGYDDMAAES